jgi:hypothetical protein
MPFDEYAARIQTVSSAPCPDGGHDDNLDAFRRGIHLRDNSLCLLTKDGDWWHVAELHPPMACNRDHANDFDNDNPVQHVKNWTDNECVYAAWTDETPGAVPHTKPEPEPDERVTGKMVDAAMESLLHTVSDLPYITRGDIRDVIEAALAAEDK